MFMTVTDNAVWRRTTSEGIEVACAYDTDSSAYPPVDDCYLGPDRQLALDRKEFTNEALEDLKRAHTGCDTWVRVTTEGTARVLEFEREIDDDVDPFDGDGINPAHFDDLEHVLDALSLPYTVVTDSLYFRHLLVSFDSEYDEWLTSSGEAIAAWLKGEVYVVGYEDPETGEEETVSGVYFLGDEEHDEDRQFAYACETFNLKP